jgi:hypothetical protein
MALNSGEAITGFLFVTIVSGIFIISSAMRAKKNWIAIKDPDASTLKRNISKLGLVFEIIIFTTSTLFYFVFLFNVGK